MSDEQATPATPATPSTGAATTATPAAPAAPAAPTLTLRDADLPPLFHHADRRAARAQRGFFGWLSWELMLLWIGVLTGVVGVGLAAIWPAQLGATLTTIQGRAISGETGFEIAEALLLAIALLMRVVRVATHPEFVWYEARAVAESVKSIAWRYAVGGAPFGEERATAEADQFVQARMRETLTDVTRYKAPNAITTAEQITPAMRALRALPLDARKEVYRVDRVKDQEGWYTRKSRFNRRRAWQAHAGVIAAEVLAVAAALVAALHVIPLNLQSLMTTIAGAGAAWMQAKRYEDLEVSYKVTARELAKVASDSAAPATDAAWANFVENAEGSMSREHQLWRATRTI